MNLFVQPMAFRELRDELFKVRTDLASTLVREGEFTEPAPGLTVYAQTVDGGGRLGNLFIHQTKPDGSATTYTAEQGRLGRSDGRPVLIMQNGSYQEFSRRGVLNYLTFNEYAFDLAPLSSDEELVHYKPSDRYMHELFFPDLQQDWERRNRLGLLAEGHARIASPLYNIAVMALALYAIIGGGFSRLGYGRRIVVIGASAAVLRILGFQVEAAAEDAAWLNVLQYAIPIGATGFVLARLFRQKVNRHIDITRPRRLAVAGAPA
jgi:lipopolysaccharide export system permease protein